jgi:DNA-3-methyladenine glycosylase I
LAGDPRTGGEHRRPVPEAAVLRCAWVPDGDSLYVAYHDEEWGVPSRDPIHLFEMLVLEGAQAGLSWSTILHKREGYRRAFAGFDPERVARLDSEQLLQDAGIVRNRLKVESSISNARVWLEQDDPVELLWSFVGGTPKVNRFRTLSELPAQTPESAAMSKELKRRGFRFVGPTVCYSLMQACGLVDDHTTDCFRYGVGSTGRSESRS